MPHESYHVPQPRAEREHSVSLIRQACSLQLNESGYRGDERVVMLFLDEVYISDDVRAQVILLDSRTA